VTRAALALALTLGACSPSPQYPDTCGVAVVSTADAVPACGTLPLEGLPVCGAPAEWLTLSARVWGAYDACTPDAIRVVVKPIDSPDAIGQAVIHLCIVRIEPDAYPPEIVLAHEIGHLMGYDHEDDPCALMAPNAASRSCGSVSIAGCEYGVGQWVQ